LYSLYSVALYKLTGEKRHREIGLRAAEVLARRFIPEGNYIQAWGRMDGSEPHFQGLAIIDGLMNLPLLYWAALESGNSWLHEVAIRHADTTLQHLIRADGSAYHSFRFDPKTGAPLGPANYCGYSVESHWARGTAWAIYGFALSHRYTGEARFLDASLRLARNFISRLDNELVPQWDFKLPDGTPKLRDSSASAITICGLQELISMKVADQQLAAMVTPLLARLCEKTTLDRDKDCPGLLRNAQTGFSENVAINGYSSWGDYFLMEALSREVGASGTFW
jgi:unsaturated chondroitin disaccharide hydrolase